MIAHEEEEEHVDGEDPLTDEDHAAAAEVVGEMPGAVPDDPADGGHQQIAVGKLGGGRTELLDRPDAHEVPRTRAGERADERDEQDRSKRPVDVRTPDQVHEAAKHPARR